MTPENTQIQIEKCHYESEPFVIASFTLSPETNVGTPVIWDINRCILRFSTAEYIMEIKLGPSADIILNMDCRKEPVETKNSTTHDVVGKKIIIAQGDPRISRTSR